MRAEKAEALVAEMKSGLDKLTQELYDSKHLAARRLRSLNAWKEVAKNLRKDFYIAQGSFLDAMKLLREAEALAADRLKIFENYRDDSKGIEILLKEIINKQQKLLRRALNDLKEVNPQVGGAFNTLINDIEEELGDES